MKPYVKDLCSVCCLSYNHSEFLKQCIQSLWDQSYRNIEILALDDGSSDNSASLLEQLSVDSNVEMKVFKQKNSGNIGKNFNQLIDHAAGEYILIIAMDDYLSVDAIAQKIQVLSQDINCVLCGNTKVIPVDQNNTVLKDFPVLPLEGKPEISAKEILDLEYETLGTFFIQGAVIRHTFLDSIGKFDEDLIGDDIILRTKIFQRIEQNSNLKFVLFDYPSLYYRRHTCNVSNNTIRQCKICAEYVDRYWKDQPWPELLIEMSRNELFHSSLKNSFKVFNISPGSSSLIYDQEILRMLLEKLAADDNCSKSFFKIVWKLQLINLKQLIYKKTKGPDGVRNCVLLSCIKFSYKRKKKSNN